MANCRYGIDGVGILTMRTEGGFLARIRTTNIEALENKFDIDNTFVTCP